jgi:hypothetical protein
MPTKKFFGSLLSAGTGTFASVFKDDKVLKSHETEEIKDQDP